MAEAKRPDSRGLNFLDITDFSPGIYDNSLIAAGSTPTTTPGIFPAPPGAADASATFGCMALANGGLGPLPAASGFASAGLSLSDLGITVSGAADITCIANSFQQATDELVLGVNTISGGSQTFKLWSTSGGTGAQLIFTSTGYSFTANHTWVAYPFTTTMSGFQPVMIFGVVSPDGALAGDLLVYPEIGNPNSFAADDITQHQAGSTFGHQGRIVQLQLDAGYGWPRPPTIFPNELFNYTNPPQTETWPVQGEQFGPEAPFGYGAVNSVSAGELFLVKRRGGAVIIQGDLNNPTVTSLTGVKSTGNIYGRSDTDSNGMYYCVQEQGAWVWNGGNTSAKVSAQLDDNFYVAANRIPGPWYTYYCQRWGDWMVFSNNWIFNSTTGAWWRLSDPGVRSFFYAIGGYDLKTMFFALNTVTSGSQKFLFQYDRTVPGASFTWQSLPIKVPGEDRTATARELVIRASNPYGDSAPQIIPTLIDDKGNATVLPTWTMTPGIDTIQEWRVNAGVKQTTTLAVKLTCSGSSFAPVVAGLSMATRGREHLGAN